MKVMSQQETINSLAEWEANREVAAKAFQLVFGQPEVRLTPEHLELREFFPSPLSIPEGKSGKISITHRYVEDSTPVVSMREAIMSRTPTVTLALDKPLRIHELRDAKAGLWMTDLPQELHQIARMIRDVRPRGRVLVGGLGLGLVVHFLTRRTRTVAEITVVERSPHVVKLVAPHLPTGPVRVVQADIKNFLRAHLKPFDYYLLDTWQGTSESTWWDEVLPLKRVIRQVAGDDPKIHCWAEDIMAGQVLQKLASGSRDWLYEGLPPSMSAEEAAYFFARAGEAEWEQKYGRLVSK